MDEKLYAKGRSYKIAGGVVAVLGAIAVAIGAALFQHGQVLQDQAQQVSVTADGASDKLARGGAGGSTFAPGPTRLAATEHGAFEVCHVHAAQPWLRDCEVAQNFLADEGETYLLDCFYRGTNCPTTFTMSLLSTSASPAETSTWTALSANELVSGTSAGYAAASITRDSTGWTTLDTVSSGTGGCTETVCARVSTKQVVITASGNWSAAARYISIHGTIGGVEKHIATAQLSADRQLQQNDQLQLTYRQAMQ